MINLQLGMVYAQTFHGPADKIDGNKINACFITLNSENEKHVFSKHLSQGPNRDKFNLIELNNGSRDWFNIACKSKIRCDLVLISGEFAGRFFGDKGNLTLEEIESKSCTEECKGLLNDPKEVFLMGCNTLAGKEEDSRTAEEYLNVLVTHGTPLPEAVLRTEERYGSVNNTNRNRFQKAFKGVPHIYGFNSIGPSGKTVEPMLKNYLQKVPDYSDHMTKLETRKAVLLSGKVLGESNNELEKSLRYTAFIQCNGYPTSKDMDETTRFNCLLNDPKKSKVEKLEAIRDVLKSGDIGITINEIHHFLSGMEPYYLNEDETRLLNSIKGNQEIRARFLESMDKIKMPHLKLKYSDLAVQYGWLGKDAGKEAFVKAVQSSFSPPMNTEKINFICGAGFQNVIDHEFVATTLRTNNFLDDESGWRIVDCLKIKTPYIQEQEILFLTSQDETKRKRALKALVSSGKENPSFHGKIAELAKSGDWEILRELEKEAPLPQTLIDNLASHDEILTRSSFGQLLANHDLNEKTRLRLMELSLGENLNESYAALINFENSLKKRGALTENESDDFLKKMMPRWNHLQIAERAYHYLPKKNPQVARSMIEDLMNYQNDLKSNQQYMYNTYLTETDVRNEDLKIIWKHLKENPKTRNWMKEMVLKDVLQHHLDKMDPSDQKAIRKSKLFK